MLFREAYVQAIKKVLVLTDAYVLVIGDDASAT